MMNKILCVLLFSLLAVSALAGTRSALREGGKFYNDEKYGSALNSYQTILKEQPNHEQALFNAGDAYYRLNEYTQAEEQFKKAAEAGGEYAQSALFNLGNTYYRTGNRKKAIETYKAAILANPQDKEAMHNLQLVLMQEQQKQENQNNENNQDDKSDNQNQQDQDNQGQSPQELEQNQQEQQQNKLSQNAADRVMAMAKENEYKRAPSGGKPEQMVEKDW